MKVLIESYNNIGQNTSGGIQIRIQNFVLLLKKNGINVKLFNKWTDKIEDFDILHIFKVNTEDYQMMLYAKNIGKPVVISSIVPLDKSYNILLNRVIGKALPIHTGYFFLERMLKMADLIIAQTKKEASFINKNYCIKNEKIRVLPNGANTNILNGDTTLIVNKLKTEVPFILQVGRFDKNKNQLNIIRAMKGSKIPVVFIGGPDPSEPEYYKICLAEASDNMHFLGWVKNNDPMLSSAYSKAQVVVLPSFKEIFGNSLIEGGAAGANLVATQELPIDDWGLTEYCMTINPGNIKSIQEALLESYNKPKDLNISKLILEKFSWDSIIKQHIIIYEQLIQNSKK